MELMLKIASIGGIVLLVACYVWVSWKVENNSDDAKLFKRIDDVIEQSQRMNK